MNITICFAFLALVIVLIALNVLIYFKGINIVNPSKNYSKRMTKLVNCFIITDSMTVLLIIVILVAFIISTFENIII